jgi:uncharacterized LabA/DUF88 family protein
MEEITYLFIDGGYFKATFRETVNKIFGTHYEIDYTVIKQQLRARRVFYYDCVDEYRKANESKEEFNKRIGQQKEYLDAIDSLEGFHVRRSYLVSEKRKQQKEVDVLLAVDMMTNSFNHNISKAILISGDRDFKPVIESITRAGTYVEVMYRKKTGSKELGREADKVTLLDIELLIGWAKIEEGEKRESHFPRKDFSQGGSGNRTYLPWGQSELLKEGLINDGKKSWPVKLSYREKTAQYAITILHGKVYIRNYFFTDLSLLETFVTEQYGAITWQ